MKNNNLKAIKEMFSVNSILALIVIDSIGAFDPTQTFLGFGLMPVALVVVFLFELSKQKDNKKNLFEAIGKGIIGAVIVGIPTPFTSYILGGLRFFK